MDKKAFTLIELLAVIVILGILALIVTPILINVVKDSNEKSYKLSADGYISAVNDYILSNQLDGKKVENGKYNIKNLDVKISGKAPSKGSVEIYDEKVSSAQLLFDTYLVKYDGKKVTLTEKGCEKEATVNLVIGEKEYDNVAKVAKDDIETEFNISDDISDMTNIVCNNGVTISMNDNTLKLSDVYKDTNCTMSRSINDTFNNLDDTKNYILMLKDEKILKTLENKETKNVTIELNGKSITASNVSVIHNLGTLSILNNSLNVSSLNSNVATIGAEKNSVLSLKNISVVSENTDNKSSICNKGKLEVKNSYIKGPYGIGCNDEAGAEINVQDSKIVATVKNGVSFNKTSFSENAPSGTISSSEINGKNIAVAFVSTGTLSIESGKFNSETGNVIMNSNSGTININSGTYISKESTAISNSNSGTINIQQSNKSVYISSLAQIWKPAVLNNSSGKINIKGNKANNCTNDSTKTTSGICIYAEGNKDYTKNTSNGGIQNHYTGNINVDGATIFGGNQGVNNGSTGTLNIKNSNVSSGRAAIFNNGVGTINICSSILSAPLLDIHNYGGGIINYSNLNKDLKIYNPTSGTINSNYTGSCVE